MDADEENKKLPLDYGVADDAPEWKRDALLCLYAAPPVMFVGLFIIVAGTNSYPVAHLALFFGLIAVVAGAFNLVTVLRRRSGLFMVTLFANAIVALLSVPDAIKSGL